MVCLSKKNGEKFTDIEREGAFLKKVSANIKKGADFTAGAVGLGAAVATIFTGKFFKKHKRHFSFNVN